MTRQEQAHLCGWCITGHHKSCKTEVIYYDKTWRCECAICHQPKKKPRKK